MALGRELTEVRDVFRAWYRSTVEPKLQEFRYIREIALALAIALGAGVGMFGYRYYTTSREQEAQLALAELMQEFRQGQYGRGFVDWTDLATRISLEYNQHSGSYLAPYFLVLQADALAKQGDKAEAVQMMDQALGALGKSSPLHYAYATKRALMQLDTEDAQEKNAGLEALTTLAHDTKNTDRDAALFYLGSYHWSQKDMDNAKKSWQELVATFEKAKPAALSPWVELAKERLDQLA